MRPAWPLRSRDKPCAQPWMRALPPFSPRTLPLAVRQAHRRLGALKALVARALEGQQPGVLFDQHAVLAAADQELPPLAGGEFKGDIVAGAHMLPPACPG